MTLQKSTVYTFPVKRIDRFENKEFYVIEYENQDIKVLKYPKQSLKDEIRCVYIGDSSNTGKPMFKQDMNQVLDEYYEEDCVYDFKVWNKCYDDEFSASYLLLLDAYNLMHRLYVPTDDFSDGEIISCRVKRIVKGYLQLELSGLSNVTSMKKTLNQKHDFNDSEQCPIDFSNLNPAEDLSLRDYQIQNKQKIYSAWRSCRSVMLQMPTGTGKTRLFVSIVKDLHNWGADHKRAVKVLILAHRKELIEQISNNVGLKYGLAHGLITANNQENKLYPVQVGSVPTLNRRLDRWEDKNFDVIIIDEAHHVKADSYKKILNQYPAAKILGVTATPYRLNGSGFRPEFDELIVSPSVSEFIQKGYLCEYDYYSIRLSSNLQKQIDHMALAFDGDYQEEAMMDVMDKDSIRANIIDTYMKFARGKKGIVYTINKSHNEHICNKFNDSGVKAVAIDSTTPKEKRDEYVAKFRLGKIDVLCNVNIFSEGFDCPDVEFIQLARPTKSLSLYLQQVGRGLRPADNKEKLIILDNVGLYNKFGFPSSRRHWKYHFEGGKDVDDVHYDSFSTDEHREIFDIEEGNEHVDLLHTSNQDLKDELSNQENMDKEQQPVQSCIDYKTQIEDLDKIIDLCKKYGLPVSEKVYDKRSQLMKLDLQKELGRLIRQTMLAFGLDDRLSLDYTLKSGVTNISYESDDDELKNQLSEVQEIIKLCRKNNLPATAESLALEQSLKNEIFKLKEIEHFKKWMIEEFIPHFNEYDADDEEGSYGIIKIKIRPNQEISLDLGELE